MAVFTHPCLQHHMAASYGSISDALSSELCPHHPNNGPIPSLPLPPLFVFLFLFPLILLPCRVSGDELYIVGGKRYLYKVSSSADSTAAGGGGAAAGGAGSGSSSSRGAPSYIGICSYCSNTFCSACGNSAHGDTPCTFSASSPEAAQKSLQRLLGHGFDGPSLQLFFSLPVGKGVTVPITPASVKAAADKMKSISKGSSGKGEGEEEEDAFTNGKTGYSIWEDTNLWNALATKHGAGVWDSMKDLVWLAKHTRPCPSCKTTIEKNGGCNHMHCSHCECDFCFLCGAKVGMSEEVWHFSDNRISCYGRQFKDEGALRVEVTGDLLRSFL